MNRKPILITLAVLMLMTMACRISFDLPVTDVKTGPTQTKEINVPLPSDTSTIVDVTLSFAAGELKLAPGAEDALIKGTATFNVADLEPVVKIDDDRVSIETGDATIRGIPNFKGKFKNTWELTLGNVPMNMTINAGAYQGRLELGGVPIQSLKVGDGAAEVELSFSDPNPVEMDTLRYDTGASQVKLLGLGNANVDTLVFKGGAGDYTLDFSGDLQRAMNVTIDSGVSSVKVIVPQGVSARLFFDGGLSNVDVNGDWEKSGNTYTQRGSGPTITINVNLGAGSLTLSNR
jgi:hypothetical protein